MNRPAAATLNLHDELIARFESEWTAELETFLADFLARHGDSDHLLLVELVHIDLEFRLKAGQRAFATDYRRFPPFDHDDDAFVELLAAEFRLRSRGEPSLSIEDFCSQQPQFREKLSSILAAAVDQFPKLPGYELIRVIGRGGMGIVYKARQASLRRVVALKMIRPEYCSGTNALARFKAEAHSVAQLHHENIVGIFDIGDYYGRPFFTMQYVEGRNLADILADGSMPPLVAAQLVGKLAVAIQHAHDHGIVHRDLKPANIILDNGNNPKIADFGLAKSLDAAVGLTVTGDLLGTPQYMAPEQASGQSSTSGAATDIYGLGAILYALLTGVAPVQADSLIEAVKELVDREPVSPRARNPAVDVALERICLKCLAKSTQSRYSSARELAEDLDRYLHRLPVYAQPIVQQRRGWMYRRNWLVVVVLFVVFGVIYRGGTRFEWGSIVGVANRSNHADSSWVNETLHPVINDAATEGISSSVPHSDVSERIQNDSTSKPVTNNDGDNRALVGLALFPAKLSGIQRWQLATRMPRGLAPLVAWNPDGESFANFCDDGFLRIFGVTGQETELRAMFPCGMGGNASKRSISWSANGSFIAVADVEKSNIDIWHISAKRRLPAPIRHQESITCAIFSPVGEQIVTGDTSGSLRIWDHLGRMQLETTLGAAAISDIAWSPEANRLAVTQSDGKLHVLWAKSGSPIFSIQAHHGNANSVTWHPNQQFLATSGDDSRVKVWDENGQEKHDLSGADGRVRCVEWDSTGQYLAAASRNIAIWKGDVLASVQDAEPASSIECESLSWHPHKQELLISGPRFSVEAFSLQDDKCVRLLNGVDLRVESASWNGDATEVVVSTRGGPVFGFDTSGVFTRNIPRPPTRVPLKLIWSPNGRWIAAVEQYGGTRLFVLDAKNGNIEDTLTLWTSPLNAAWSADNRWLIAGGLGKVVNVWGSEQRQIVQQFFHTRDGIGAIGTHQNENRFTIADEDGFLTIGVIGDDGQLAPKDSFRITNTAIRDVAWHPNKDLLGVIDNSRLQVIDLERRDIRWSAPGWSLKTVAWGDSGQTVFCGCVGRFSLQTGAYTADFDDFNVLGADRFAKHLVAGGWTQNLRFYDSMGHLPVRSVVLVGDGTAVSIDTDGRLLTTDAEQLRAFTVVVQNDDATYDCLQWDEFVKRFGDDLGWH